MELEKKKINDLRDYLVGLRESKAKPPKQRLPYHTNPYKNWGAAHRVSFAWPPSLAIETFLFPGELLRSSGYPELFIGRLPSRKPKVPFIIACSCETSHLVPKAISRSVSMAHISIKGTRGVSYC